MNLKNILKSLLLTAAVSLGLAAPAVAGGDPLSPPPVPASGSMGLLGQTYAALTYSYLDLDNTSSHADVYRFEFNESLNAGLDTVLSYDWTQAGSSGRQHALMAGLRAFSTSYVWGRPYAEAEVGYAWAKAAGASDNSFTWQVGVGAEFQIAPAFTVTPYVKYVDAPSLARGNRWEFGVKANYWVNSQWAVTGGINRDDDQNVGFTVGTSFRF